MASIDYTIIGKHFGRLIVLDFDHMGKHGESYWLCECTCPKHNKLIVSRSSLIKRHTVSCGCYKSDLQRKLKTTHGEHNSRLHNIWGNMKQRCSNKNNTNYQLYGERGIDICDEWYDDFEAFRNWSVSNGYSDNLTLDRIDNDGYYCPDNCRWVDHYTQMNNTRKTRHIIYNGETHSISEWARILNVSYNLLYYRLIKNDMSLFEEYFKKGNCNSK